MGKIKLPSVETIVDTAVTEVLVNAIWYGLTRFADIHSAARDWGFVMLSLGVLVMVGWYLGRKLPSKQDKLPQKSEPAKGKQKTKTVISHPEVMPSVVLSKEQQDLLDFYEQQKTNWEQYITLNIANVLCYTKAKTPYLVFQLLVRNFHSVSFKIVKIKADGTLNHSGNLGNLPSIKDDEERNFGRCGEGQFNLKLEINGTGLPTMLESAAEKMDSVQWIIQGQWHIEIYGKVQLWRRPPNLIFSKIPQIMAGN